MELKTRTLGSVVVLELSGRFDAFEVPAVTEWIDKNLTSTPANAIFNLSGVTFVDSSALASMVKALKRCREHNGTLALCAMQQAVRIIFELTRLDKAFDIYADEETALNALNGK